MATLTLLQQMLEQVARALGPELCQQMTFVGGCTTGLLLTDAYTKEQVRHTEDVDLIVHTVGYMGFHNLQQQLTQKGFKLAKLDEPESQPICAMWLGNLRVDFMPDDDTLGFTNQWYKAAMATATDYPLAPGLNIRLVSPVYFLATKLVAYHGRGKGDVLSSRDIEDILNLVDGRPELCPEVQAASVEVKQYISQEISKLLADPQFDYAVASQAQTSSDREALMFERLEALANLAPQ